MKFKYLLTCTFIFITYIFSYGQTADEWLEKGRKKYESAEYQFAVEAFDKAIKINPNYAIIYCERGKARRKLGLYEGAIQDFNKSIEINPNYLEAYLYKGRIKIDLHDSEGAIQDFNIALKINPNYAEAYTWRGRAKIELNRYDEALKDHDRAIKINPNSAEAYNEISLTKYLAESYQEAISDCERSIELDSTDTFGYCMKGILLLQLNQNDRALASFRMALETTPINEQHFSDRGYAYFEIGEYDQAIKESNNAIRIAPNHHNAFFPHHLIGIINYTRGEFEFANQKFDEAINLNPKNEDSYLYKGFSLIYLNQHEKAINNFRKVIQIDPKSIDAYINMGNSLCTIGNHKDAIETCYNKAIEVDPDSYLTYTLRAESYYEIGQYDKALSDYNQALQIYPALTDLHVEKARIKALLGRYYQAIHDIDITINAGSDSYNLEELNNFRLFCLMSSGETTIDAFTDYTSKNNPNYTGTSIITPLFSTNTENCGAIIEFYDDLIEFTKVENHALYFWRGLSLYSCGKTEDAIGDLDKTIEINPNYADAYYIRGDARFNLGLYSEAIQDYNTFLYLQPNSNRVTEVLFERGITYHFLQNYSKALEDYNAALGINPKYSEALCNRAIIRDFSGDYKAAVKDYNKAIKINPSRALFYFNRAVTLNNMKEYRKAINDLDKVIKVNPSYIGAYKFRGDVKSSIGEIEASKADYNRYKQLLYIEQQTQETLTENIDTQNLPRVESPFEIKQASRVWAMAVGIGQYKFEKNLTPLAFSATNASSFVRYMERTGFSDNDEVPLLTNSQATKSTILQKMRETFLSPKIQEDDMIFFYFSGHGMALADENFGICQYDFFPGKNLIEDTEIIDILKKSPAKHKVCFIESCKSEVRTAAVLPQELKDDFNNQRSRIDESIVFITSTLIGEESYEYPKIGGVFSHYLMKGIKGAADIDGNKQITTKELFDYLRKEVSEYTSGAQVPQINDDYKDIPLFIMNDKN